MKLDLKNIHSPCCDCYARGQLYSPDDINCQRCEYNVAIQLLKTLLKFNDGCSLCKNRMRYNGYNDCQITDDCACNIGKDFVIDWQSTFKEYGFTFE